jgi:hypothetical protein
MRYNDLGIKLHWPPNMGMGSVSYQFNNASIRLSVGKQSVQSQFHLFILNLLSPVIEYQVLTIHAREPKLSKFTRFKL